MQERTNYIPQEVIGEINRDEQSNQVVRLLEKLDIPEITGNEVSKREYIKQLNFEGFKRLLLTLNGNLMDIPPAKREFFAGEMELAAGDRENPLLGWAEGTKDTYTPLQQDKDELCKVPISLDTFSAVFKVSLMILDFAAGRQMLTAAFLMMYGFGNYCSYG